MREVEVICPSGVETAALRAPQVGREELSAPFYPRHCEERSDEAIHAAARGEMDCFATLAMTGEISDLTHYGAGGEM